MINTVSDTAIPECPDTRLYGCLILVPYFFLTCFYFFHYNTIFFAVFVCCRMGYRVGLSTVLIWTRAYTRLVFKIPSALPAFYHTTYYGSTYYSTYNRTVAVKGRQDLPVRQVISDVCHPRSKHLDKEYQNSKHDFF